MGLGPDSIGRHILAGVGLGAGVEGGHHLVVVRLGVGVVEVVPEASGCVVVIVKARSVSIGDGGVRLGL